MTKHSSSLQRSIVGVVLRALIGFTLLRSGCTRNSFDDLDLRSQTLNPTVTGFMVTGNSANDRFGSSVSAAGDINNDGYDDIIVTAEKKNNWQGVAYVIYGEKESSFLNLDLSTTTLDPLTTGFLITGSAAYDYFGASVSTAGDMNNDGYDDIIVGAYAKNGYQGAAYVIYGGPKSAMSNIDLGSTILDPLSTGFMITGQISGDNFGGSVSTAGDINKDGYDDVIVGAPYKNNQQGAVYVIYGGPKSTMSNIVLGSTTLDPTSTGFVITGNAAYDRFGFSVSMAGDMNNDGYADIIVGAYTKNSQQGAAYVIYGGAMSNNILSSTTLDPTSTGFIITGNAAGDCFGYSVSAAGDMNNDGYDDIIVGAWEKNNAQGAAYVIYGRPKSTMSNIDLSSTTLDPTSTGFMITGNAAYSYLGFSVTSFGDINNDGYHDVIVGALDKRIVYVIYGGAKSTMSNIDLSSTPLDPLTTGITITGNAADYGFGFSVSRGDINNDGYDDIIVGVPDKSSSKGAVYVIFASCSANCKTCSSEPVCTECKTPYLLYQSKCFASCPEGTLATSTTICEDCPVNCKHCSSKTACTECKNAYILYQSQCLDSCPDGMFLSTTICEYCQSPCSQCTSISLCTECTSPLALYGSQCLISCPKTMFNSNNICKDCPSGCSSCLSEDACQVCFEGFTLSNSLCVAPPSSSSSQQTQEKATKVLSSAAQGISSVVCVGSVVVPLAALVSKIVQNTRYLNLSVTSDLAEIYQTWDTDLISWEVPNLFSNEDHFRSSPYLFARYDIDSPFLVNFWPTLLNIGIGLTTSAICIILQKFFQKSKYEGWAYSLLLKLLAGSFNFALVQAYACLDDISLYLVLDAKTNPFNTSFSWASMICASIFLALGCLLVFFNFWIVKKYQDIKSQGAKSIDAFNEKNKYWELFYSDFSDNDFYTQSFFAVLIIRSTLSSLIIALLYDYPLMQAAYLVIIDVAILSLLYFQTPFNTLRGKLAQYYYEIITFMVHICTFILSLQDTFTNSSDTVRLVFSTSIIYLNTALIGGSLGFLFIEIYFAISEKTKAGQLKQYENIAIQTEIETTNQDQRRLESSTNNQQVPHESFHLMSGTRNPDQSGPNFESSHILEPNLTIDSSRELVMKDQSITPTPIIIRRRLRVLNPQQQQHHL